MPTYTHKNIEFDYLGRMCVMRKGTLLRYKLKLNNYSPGWRLSRTIFLSVKQLEELIKK